MRELSFRWSRRGQRQNSFLLSSQWSEYVHCKVIQAMVLRTLISDNATIVIERTRFASRIVFVVLPVVFAGRNIKKKKKYKKKKKSDMRS
jgi:hypothetical protein